MVYTTWQQVSPIKLQLYFQWPYIVIDNKSEMKAALWRLPLVDETQPPSQSAAPGHPRSLYKLCDLDNNGESMKRYYRVYITEKLTNKIGYSLYFLWVTFLVSGSASITSNLVPRVFSLAQGSGTPAGGHRREPGYEPLGQGFARRPGYEVASNQPFSQPKLAGKPNRIAKT
jgi:hypothetical protein